MPEQIPEKWRLHDSDPPEDPNLVTLLSVESGHYVTVSGNWLGIGSSHLKSSESI